MANEQAQNFNQRFNTLQNAVDTSRDFFILRQDINKLRDTLSSHDLHPNAARKFRGWAAKMFYQVNNKEKDHFFSSLTEIETKLSDIGKDPFKYAKLQTVHEQMDQIQKWLNINASILEKKPDRSHTVSKEEIRDLKIRVDTSRGQINAIQQQRTIHFRQQREDFERDLASVEVLIGDLEATSPEDELNNAIRKLYDLQNRTKAITKKKRDVYEKQIQELMTRCKGIRREQHQASIQLISQENQSKYERILDDIEDKLAEEVIPNNKLKALKDVIFNDAWHPLSENENRRYKIILTTYHRDALFSRMRALLAQIDEKRDNNRELIAECKANGESFSTQLGNLDTDFIHYRDQYEENKIIKGDFLRSLNEIKTETRGCQQQLRTGHFFVKDRRIFYDRLSQLWANVSNVIQFTANPEWSEEWLKDKIRKNISEGEIYLKLVDGIPRAS